MGGKNSAPPPDYKGAINQMGPAIDWKRDFGGAVGNGQDAANQAYGQLTSRLDPMWANREESARTRLLNQGLDPSSEAFQRDMTQLGQERNDAYGQAQNQAFQMGRGVFADNLASRQQAIAEALRRRSQPLTELGAQQDLWMKNGEMEASMNPLGGLGDLVGAGLDVAGMFGLGIPGQGSLLKGVTGGGKK